MTQRALAFRPKAGPSCPKRRKWEDGGQPEPHRGPVTVLDGWLALKVVDVLLSVESGASAAALPGSPVHVEGSALVYNRAGLASRIIGCRMEESLGSVFGFTMFDSVPILQSGLPNTRTHKRQGLDVKKTTGFGDQNSTWPRFDQVDDYLLKGTIYSVSIVRLQSFIWVGR